MRNILIIGAGKSTPYIVKYLMAKSSDENLFLTIGDLNLNNAKKLSTSHTNFRAIKFDILNRKNSSEQISKSDIVISMLPARFHVLVAKECLKYKKSLLTASYISDEMNELDKEVKSNGIIFMNEIGLDPGIDHMSAMKIIDQIKDDGSELVMFKSYTGGLIAPESDNNLWNYKFTWNPRNVVLAGQGGDAKFIEKNKYKQIPYNELFKNTEPLEIDKYGDFEAYANRDSLKYQNIYKLNNIETLFRGTIRRAGFCNAWDVFVSLGMTDDSYKIKNSHMMSYREYVNYFLSSNLNESIESKIKKKLEIDEKNVIWDKLLELDIFNSAKQISLKNATPAQILEYILLQNWQLEKNDKDMVVMYHKFGYKKNKKLYQIDSTMVSIGEDETYTAMAKTVGLPLAIAAIAILNKKIKSIGVQLPTSKEIYLPILKELEKYNIKFKEKLVPFKL
ncbi:MAG: saccharopine dehydrogenase [Flavobacteriaceae bacterium]|jgi:saccharopine dehydrogenase-like NADP-dependent oxidoreductase|nr:saccharopine dehydrogenase [Flavobacteriaceae bacterium]MBT5246403.1 saccharopine dehydrogenase [Flavobacteriaceae bacterium]MBT5650748.1 saccharopine dehydrogenase [Flavobacteriaceae bacterium]MBT5772558.1 saccharopine dehydrogenase [Flavobacteriaceae bacterium]MBT6636262.1 saccharopine dehydrogenase [Flavobacteriaceae bacterium]